MAISFNTSGVTDSGNSATASVAFPVPAGVQGQDVVLIAVAAFAVNNGATITATSTGTAPTLITQNQTPLFAGNRSDGSIWYFIAAGPAGQASSDAGKTMTFQMSDGGTAFWSGALAAYTGASPVAPVDVSAGADSASTTTSINTPVLSTGKTGDWAIQLFAGGTNTSTLNEPAGTTSRVKHIAVSLIAADIVDSNGGVGPPGTSIGGGTYSTTAGNCWLAAFTVGLTPPFVNAGGCDDYFRSRQRMYS